MILNERQEWQQREHRLSTPQSAFSCCPVCAKTRWAHQVWHISDRKSISTCWSHVLWIILFNTCSSVCIFIIYKEQHLHIPITLGATIKDACMACMLRWAVGYGADHIVASPVAEAQRRLMTQAPLWTRCSVHITWVHLRMNLRLPFWEPLVQILSQQPNITLQVIVKKEGFVEYIHICRYIGLYPLKFHFRLILKSNI